MALLNAEMNPTRMTYETRAKLRAAHLDSGEGRTYTKEFGVHEHRAVAERMLGRELLPGEVVHHNDGDKRNNAPENLTVFPSQSCHAKWHAMVRRGEVLPNDVPAKTAPELLHRPADEPREA